MYSAAQLLASLNLHHAYLQLVFILKPRSCWVAVGSGCSLTLILIYWRTIVISPSTSGVKCSWDMTPSNTPSYLVNFLCFRWLAWLCSEKRSNVTHYCTQTPSSSGYILCLIIMQRSLSHMHVAWRSIYFFCVFISLVPQQVMRVTSPVNNFSVSFCQLLYGVKSWLVFEERILELLLF